MQLIHFFVYAMTWRINKNLDSSNQSKVKAQHPETDWLMFSLRLLHELHNLGATLLKCLREC